MKSRGGKKGKSTTHQPKIFHQHYCLQRLGTAPLSEHLKKRQAGLGEAVPTPSSGRSAPAPLHPSLPIPLRPSLGGSRGLQPREAGWGAGADSCLGFGNLASPLYLSSRLFRGINGPA